jgi:hypothetical protein
MDMPVPAGLLASQHPTISRAGKFLPSGIRLPDTSSRKCAYEFMSGQAGWVRRCGRRLPDHGEDRLGAGAALGRPTAGAIDILRSTSALGDGIGKLRIAQCVAEADDHGPLVPPRCRPARCGMGSGGAASHWSSAPSWHEDRRWTFPAAAARAEPDKAGPALLIWIMRTTRKSLSQGRGTIRALATGIGHRADANAMQERMGPWAGRCRDDVPSPVLPPPAPAGGADLPPSGSLARSGGAARTGSTLEHAAFTRVHAACSNVLFREHLHVFR